MKHNWTTYNIYEGRAKGSYRDIEISVCCNCGCICEWECCGKIVSSVYFPLGLKPGRDDGLLELPECKINT